VVPVSDPLHFLEAVDGVLYLVMAGHTPRELSKRGIEILDSAGANILGVVANNLAEVLPYYYDQKYYGYGSSKRKRRG
jgi:Mrp family chromosome partitioning ATPase